MSRFLATRLFLRAIKPTQIERCVSRAPSTMSMMVCSVQTQLARPSRFLASWGKEPVIDRKEIEFRVIKCVSQHDKVNQSQVSLSSHLISDLGLDSLDQVEIIVGIEDEFKLEIEDVNSEKLLSVQDIVDFLVNYYQNTDPKAKNPGHEFPNVEFGRAET